MMAVEYTYYNTIAYEPQILKYRKQDWGLQRIMRWYVNQIPVLDEMILLADVLRVCDKYNLAVSRTEVLNCFNVYFKAKFHGNKRSYLGFLYKEFKIKDRTKTRAHRVISKHKNKGLVPLSKLRGNNPTKSTKQINTQYKVHKQHLGGGFNG